MWGFIRRMSWTWALIAAVENSIMFAIKSRVSDPVMGDVESAAYNTVTALLLAFAIQLWIDFFKEASSRAVCPLRKFDSYGEALHALEQSQWLEGLPTQPYTCSTCSNVHIEVVGRKLK